MPWSRCGLAALLVFAGSFATTEAAAKAATTGKHVSQSTAEKPANATGKPVPAAAGQQAPAAPAPPRTVSVPAAPHAAPVSAPPAPAPRFVIVLDAAHGGDDVGGHLSSGQYEKAATLTLSVRLRSLLGARGIQVVTTRES